MAHQDAPRPHWVDEQVITQAMDILETLVNLNYLIRLEADKPGLVRSYGSQADERLQVLGKLLQSIRRS